MKPEIKERWVKALRSGEYKQMKSALRTRDGFCCLVVLCDLAVKEGVAEWRGKGHAYLIVTPTGDMNENVLPSAVQKWAGLDKSDPILGTTAASFHNDDGMIFADIAAMIERDL